MSAPCSWCGSGAHGAEDCPNAPENDGASRSAANVSGSPETAIAADAVSTAESSAAWRHRWYRFRSNLRCVLGVHRWRGHHDLGDSIHVQPISGYRKPWGPDDFRVCSWCGVHATALRSGNSYWWGPTS